MGWLARITAGIVASALACTPAAAADAGRRLVARDAGRPQLDGVFRGADPARAADRAFVSEVEAIRREFVGRRTGPGPSCRSCTT